MTRYILFIFLYLTMNSCLGATPLSFNELIEKNINEFIKKTKKKGRFAIKLISSKEITMEESLVVQLETAVASTIQKQMNSDSEIVPRASIGAIWKEKSFIESKSEADFGDLIAKIKADYLVLISLNQSDKYSLLSMQVFGLQGPNEGKLIYSSSVNEVIVPGLQSQLKNAENAQEIKSLISQINSNSKNGGIFDKPKSYSDHYHNARIYSQRGEFDLSIKSYEELIKFKVQFADTIANFVLILKRIYGTDGAKVYIEKKIKDIAPKTTFLYAKQILEESPIEEIWLDESLNSFPPLINLFLIRCDLDPTEQYANKISKTTKNCKHKLMLEPANDDRIFNLLETTQNGDILQYYVDPIKGESDAKHFGFICKAYIQTTYMMIKINKIVRPQVKAKYCEPSTDGYNCTLRL